MVAPARAGSPRLPRALRACRRSGGFPRSRSTRLPRRPPSSVRATAPPRASPVERNAARRSRAPAAVRTARREGGYRPCARSRSSSRISSSSLPTSASRRATWGSASSPARPTLMRRATRCCCAPSWRSRSILRRSESPADTMRARVARNSAFVSWSSFVRRSFSRARSTAWPATSTSSGSVSARRRAR